MAEIDLKRVEVMRLSEQYEEKMKSKEVSEENVINTFH